MAWHYVKLLLVVSLIFTPTLACGPRPAGDEPNPQQRTATDREDPNSPSGVDVQVGGREGIDVQVDPNRPGTNVEVGGEDDR